LQPKGVAGGAAVKAHPPTLRSRLEIRPKELLRRPFPLTSVVPKTRPTQLDEPHDGKKKIARVRGKKIKPARRQGDAARRFYSNYR
jgi:hypothetical protein